MDRQLKEKTGKQQGNRQSINLGFCNLRRSEAGQMDLTVTMATVLLQRGL